MKALLRLSLLFTAISGTQALSANHHHHGSDNPPCNHESLEDAWESENHKHV